MESVQPDRKIVYRPLAWYDNLPGSFFAKQCFAFQAVRLCLTNRSL